MKKTGFYVAILSLSAIGCGGVEEDLDEYYYTLEDHTEGKVYVFGSEEDEYFSEYWKMYTVDDELITEGYNADFDQIELFREKLGDDAATVTEFTMMYQDQVVKTKIIQSDVYYWKEAGPYTYEVEYFDDLGKGTFSKSREYVGLETIDVMGEQMKCAKFKSTLITEYPDHEERFEHWRYEHYAKGYGCVRMESHFEEEIFTEVLKEVLTIKEWEQHVFDNTPF